MMTINSVIPGRDEVASPESISPLVVTPDGFSDAQLRIIVRAARAPE
ncbi:hypothetical protein [Bradyrhizobium sp. NAS80.1]|nr:hypothetical protein [Bradyrhizobium sp. NAS80.1]